jgi:co-chaperonin GroES (HSP10)
MSDPKKVRAIGPWLWVKPDEEKLVSDGGIIIPETAMSVRTGLATGTVLSAGPGAEGQLGDEIVWVPSGIEDGDRIVFKRYLKDSAQKRFFWDNHFFLHMQDVVGFDDDPAGVA